MNMVRAPGNAFAGICSVKWMIPNPAGCLEITATSPGPDTVYVLLVSKLLCENTQMSAEAIPLTGRCSETGLPPSVQLFVAVTNVPSAATLISRLNPGSSSPAVVGSTTTMSFSVALGTALVKEIWSVPFPGAATTKATALETLPSALCICTEMLPACATSAGVTGPLQLFSELQDVTRAVPAIHSVEPAPGLLAVKPLPSTRSVNPAVPPA